MKISFLILLHFALVGILAAQENETISINTLNPDSAQLTNRIFRYKVYTPGKVVFKDNESTDARMNLNRLSGQMFFINPKNDTLVLARPETFEVIVVGTDSFYYWSDHFLEKLTHYASGNLAVSQAVKLVGKEKKGAYGTYSPVSSVNSNTTFTQDDQITTYVQVDENAIFKVTNNYYIGDKFNNFFPASRKSFYKVFFNRENEIKTYLNLHGVNFSRKKDLEDLLTYIHSLK
jgi:hypothetical protein